MEKVKRCESGQGAWKAQHLHTRAHKHRGTRRKNDAGLARAHTAHI